MAQIVWAEPALQDLDAIADFIALDDPEAAKRLVRKAFETVDRLIKFPASGTRPKELNGTPYRRLVVKPLLLYYRIDGSKIHVVHVVRGERRFDLGRIKRHDK
jgi:plasmid stabilization system protein ParE